MNVGDNLRIMRNKKKFSQQDIADYLGIERRTYMSWESGETDVKSSYIPKLAEFLQVKIKDLFQDKKGNIVINQQNSDNKDSSVNGVIILLTDKESVEQLVEILKKKVDNRQIKL